jgi:allantoinase
MEYDETRQLVDFTVFGDLVLPDRIIRGGTLGISNGRIVVVAGPGAAPVGKKHLDARGRYVLPGLVDTHVHTGSSSSEGIATATAAAAAGGITTIVDMPYDANDPVFSSERLRAKIEEVSELARVDVGLYGSMPKNGGTEVLEGILEAGALALKFSLYETDPNRFPRIRDGDLLRAFEIVAASGRPAVVHAELQEVIDDALDRERAADPADYASHARSRPVVSESGAVAKALEFAQWSGVKLHVAHVTHPHVAHLIAAYAADGAAVSGETCVHYLAFCDADVARLGPLAKVNPPIRDAVAREGLWAALLMGHLTTVSTDHAPWPIETKQRPMLEASSGIPGLETFLPVMWFEANNRQISLERLMKFVATNPAELFGLGNTKGKLEIGYDADFVVFDAEAGWSFDANTSHSSATWSPFHQVPLLGLVEATYVRGEPVFVDGAVTASPGYGRWLGPEANREAPAEGTAAPASLRS